LELATRYLALSFRGALLAEESLFSLISTEEGFLGRHGGLGMAR
jgi:hypothetical protein